MRGLLNVEKDGRQDGRRTGQSRGGYGGCDGWREKSWEGREVIGQWVGGWAKTRRGGL